MFSNRRGGHLSVHRVLGCTMLSSRVNSGAYSTFRKLAISRCRPINALWLAAFTDLLAPIALFAYFL